MPELLVTLTASSTTTVTYQLSKLYHGDQHMQQ